jgi:hypothetical protein
LDLWEGVRRLGFRVCAWSMDFHAASTVMYMESKRVKTGMMKLLLESIMFK